MPWRLSSIDSHSPNRAQSRGASDVRTKALISPWRFTSWPGDGHDARIGSQPAGDLDRPGGRVVDVADEQGRVRYPDVVQRQDVGGRVQAGQPAPEGSYRFRLRQIRLGHHEPVGDRRLTHGFREPVQVLRPVHRIHHRHDVAHPELMAQHRIGDQGGDDRRRDRPAPSSPGSAGRRAAPARRRGVRAGRAARPSGRREWCSRCSRSSAGPRRHRLPRPGSDRSRPRRTR